MIEHRLNELMKRVEKLEKTVELLMQWREVEDRLDSEFGKHFNTIADCIKKQKEWNDTAEESIRLLHEFVELKTGGQK